MDALSGSYDETMNDLPGKNLMEKALELHALGITLLKANKIREAEFQFKKALALAPDFTDAALCLGHCLHLSGRYDETLALYDRVLSSSPSLAAIWNNRGNTLMEMRRYDEAVKSYSRTLELSPDFHDARIALASCYQSLGLLNNALSICDSVLSTAPEHAEAHWNRSLLLLMNGDYRNGWREYEWRWRKRNFTSPLRNFPKPKWHGEPIAGKSILIHAEQGFGDTLQFCRYVPLTAALGARVIFECHPPLETLMKSLVGDVHVVAMGEELPPFDLHLPLLSMPMIFDTTLESIPNLVPYLYPPDDSITAWQGWFNTDERIRVGFCWAGKSYPDPGRSCPTELLSGLSEIEGVSWYSLQAGWKSPLPFQMNDFTGYIHDFSDTAALISKLDLVVTVDTAMAHLAGALGKPVWIMLPYAADWRWLRSRTDSPWYPTAQLFRQKEPEIWEDTIMELTLALKTFLK